MSGVLLSSGGWKRGPLRLRGVPPRGSNLLTAAASPFKHAVYRACGLMFVIIAASVRLKRRVSSIGGGGGARLGE
jgi:hypothetical protein